MAKRTRRKKGSGGLNLSGSLRPEIIGILLLLVLVLAAAVYVGWMVYQDIKRERDMAKLNDGQALIEKSKSDAIREKEPKKEKDIP